MKISASFQRTLDDPITSILDRKTGQFDKVINGIAIAIFTILSAGLYLIYAYKRLPILRQKLHEKEELIKQQEKEFGELFSTHNWEK